MTVRVALLSVIALSVLAGQAAWCSPASPVDMPANTAVVDASVSGLAKSTGTKVIGFVPSYVQIGEFSLWRHSANIADVASQIGGDVDDTVQGVSVVYPQYLPNASPESLTSAVDATIASINPGLAFFDRVPANSRAAAISPNCLLLSALPPGAVADLKLVHANPSRTYFDLMYRGTMTPHSGFTFTPTLQVNIAYGTTSIAYTDLWQDPASSAPQWERGASLKDARAALRVPSTPYGVIGDLWPVAATKSVTLPATITSLAEAVTAINEAIKPRVVVVDKRIAVRVPIVTPGTYRLIDLLSGLSKALAVRFRVDGNKLVVENDSHNVKNQKFYKACDKRLVGTWAPFAMTLRGVHGIDKRTDPFTLDDFASFTDIKYAELNGTARTSIDAALLGLGIRPSKDDLNHISIQCNLGITLTGMQGNSTTMGIGTVGIRYAELGMTDR